MKHLRLLFALVAVLTLAAAACTTEVVKEVPVEKIVTVEKEVIKEVEVPGETVVVEKEVIKEVEVPGETVVVEKEVVREVPVEVVVEKEVVKEVKVPGETIIVEKEVVKEVKVPGETVVVEKEVIKEVEVEKVVVVEKEVIKEVEVAGPGGETILTMGLTALTNSFCPWPGGTGVFHFWSALMFPTLTMPDGPNIAYAPNLAERWDIAPDGSSYTFYIQPDAVWTDGMPITAEDVAYSMRLWLDPDIGTAELTSIKGGKDYIEGKSTQIPGIVVIDDKTIRFDMETPTGLFLAKVGKYSRPLGMFPKHIMERLGDPSTIPESEWCKKPDVTGGPFKLQAAIPGQFVEFVANDDYWFGRPKIDRLITPVINSPDATLIALLRGDLDMPWRSPRDADAINDLLKDPRFNAIGVSGQTTWAFGVWDGAPHLKDPRIRQAIIHALDREKLNEVFFQGQNRIVDTMMPQDWLQSPPNSSLLYPYDPAKAKSLLAEAGWDSNREVTIHSIPGGSRPDVLFDAIQQQLAEVGFKIKWSLTGGGTWVKRWYYREPDSKAEMMFLPRTTYSDPDNWLSAVLHTSGLAARGPAYANPELDKLIEAGRGGVSNAERAHIYQEIAAQLQRDLPYLALFCCQPAVYMFNTRFSHPWWVNAPQATSVLDVEVGTVVDFNQEWLTWHLEQWDVEMGKR